MRFNIKRCLIILLACIFIPLSILSSGNSNWYVLNQTANKTETAGSSLSTNAGGSVTVNGTSVSDPGKSSNDTLITVNFHYWTMAQTGVSTTQGTPTTTADVTTTAWGTPDPPMVSFTVNGKTFKEASSAWAGYAKPYLYHTFEATETLDEATGILTKTYQVVYITAATDKTSGFLKYTRTGNVTYRVDTVVETYQAGLIREDPEDTTSPYKTFYSTQVVSGDTISRPTLTYDNYTLIGFYNSVNYLPTTEFDFSDPIDKTSEFVNANGIMTVIVQWSDQDAYNYDDSAYTSLTDTVNSLTGSLNVYAGGDYDVTADYSYSASSAVLNLGKAPNTENPNGLATTIKSGATLNLCMNSGETNHMAEEGEKVSANDVASNEVHTATGTDLFVSLDYTGSKPASVGAANPRDYTIKLQNNLTVNGTLNLGGYTGGTTLNGTRFLPQGSIIGSYVKLDLNGYTLTIANGGKLYSFGYITDTAGTGKIVVQPGGHLYSQMVITALKGGNNTLWSYAKEISPFENYYFPYLDTDVEIQATSAGAGNFTAFTKFNLGNLGFTNLYFPVIGGASNYMFYIKAKTGMTGAVNLTNIEVDSLNVSPFNLQSLHQKNCFNFENVDVAFVPPTVNVNVSVDASIFGQIEQSMDLELDRVIFPISSFLDLNFYSSTFTLAQKIQVLPGSSIMIDSESELILDYYKDSSGTITQKTFSKKTAATKSMPALSKYMVGGILAMDNDPVENSQYVGSTTGYGLNFSSTTYGTYSTYWDKVFKSANIDIYGNVKFVTGNNSTAPYTLAGNINVNTFSTSADTTKKAWNTANLATLSGAYFNSYDMQIYSGIFFWFNGDNILSSSNDGAYSAAYHFYALPMISNGTAYIHNSTLNLQGSYNGATGLFTTSTGTKYFFLANNSLLTDSSNQESAIDYTLTPTACTVGANLTITYSGSSYAYAYFGGLYFPTTATSITTSTTSVTANLKKFHSKTDYSAQALKYNTTKGYWYI